MAFFNKILFYARTQTWIKLICVFLTGLTAALLAVWLFGATYINIEGITIKAALAPARTGITEVHIPPFGVIEAKTHQGPVKLSLTLVQIQSDSLKNHINNPPDDSKELINRIRDGAADSVLVFALRQIVIAFTLALLIIILVWRTTFTKALLHALLSIIVLSVPVLYSVNSYNPQAFTEPEYKGVISMAPSLMEFASNSLTDLKSVKKNTDKVVSNLSKIFTSADSLMVMANPEEQNKVVKVLLVSDLHSNPLGIEFIKSMADNFKIDFLINLGDLTDFGTVAEASTINELQNIKIPQLFVGGNHDSPEIMDIVAGFDNCRILNGQVLSISGVKVLGFSDPLASVAAVKYESDEEGNQIMADEADRIAAEVESQGRPDILAVHNSTLGKKLMHLSELTVSGHDHRLQIEQEGGSVFINPGTSGAAGLRGLYSEEGKAYSAVIAYLVADSGLLAMDLIEYSPESKQFSLHRKVVNTFTDSETSP